MKFKNDFLQFLKNEIKGMAESHIEGWKERYFGYSIKDLKLDLNINHDPSIEIEYAEETLKRKLSDNEYTYLIKKFNQEVIKQYRNWGKNN